MTQLLIRLYAPNAGGTGLILFSLVRENKVLSATQCDIKNQKERERNKVGYSQDCLLIFGCAGLLVFVAFMRLSLVEESRGYSSLWCVSFSLW